MGQGDRLEGGHRADSPRTTAPAHPDAPGSADFPDREAYIEFLELHLAEHRRIVQRMNTERLWLVAKLRLLKKALLALIGAVDGRRG